jgi:hypothetical protein
LWARLASFVKVGPKVMPGMDVATSPVTLRIPSGAVILGSKVSIWLGPPCIIRKMTDLPVTGRPAAAAWARAWSSQGKERPPSPRVPILRKSRRVWRGPWWERANMEASVGRGLAGVRRAT